MSAKDRSSISCMPRPSSLPFEKNFSPGYAKFSISGPNESNTETVRGLRFVKQLVLMIHLVVAVDATTKSSSQILSLQHSSLLGQNLKKSDDDHDPNDVASSTVSDIGYGDHASLKVGIVIHERSDYAMRINTLQNFYVVNKRVRNCLSMAGY